MSKRVDDVPLHDMLAYAQKTRQRMSGVERDVFESADQIRESVAFNVMVIGEAASKVSPGLRGEHPEIPWPDIINMRHRIVHGYAFIDIDKLWDAATTGVASLIPALQRILAAR
jgi:uncharacterized protein with HEPN domain